MYHSPLSKMAILTALMLAFGAIAVMPPGQANDYKRDELSAVWQRIDLDRDGIATRTELDAVNARLAHTLAQADADRDGRLTFEEFEALLMNS